MLSRFVAIVVLVAASPAAAADSSAVASRGLPGGMSSPAAEPESSAVVMLETTRGTILIRLDEASAPRTAGNFRRLVQQHYFDGTYFHAVFPGFKIQGGDPNTRNDDVVDDGLGGPGYTLPAEMGLPCVRGAVVAARLPDVANPTRASSGSQFYILLCDRPDLDREGQTVFGQVIRGLDVAESIARLGKRTDVIPGRAGPDPGKRALIGRAVLVPPRTPAAPSLPPSP